MLITAVVTGEWKEIDKETLVATMPVLALVTVLATTQLARSVIRNAQDIRSVVSDESACLRVVIRYEERKEETLELVASTIDTVFVFSEPRVIRQAAAKRVEIPLSLADTIDALLQREGLSMARLPMCDADVYTWRTPTEVRHSDFGGAS